MRKVTFTISLDCPKTTSDESISQSIFTHMRLVCGQMFPRIPMGEVAKSLNLNIEAASLKETTEENGRV